MSQTQDVLDFWFGALDERGVASEESISRWWKKSDEFDGQCRSEFNDLRLRMLDGACDSWLEEPGSLVAYVVVLDQLSRNICRRTAQMYAGDERALAASHLAIERGWIPDLGVDHAVVVLMPLMHSEVLSDQDVGIREFDALAKRYPDVQRLQANVDYMQKHRDIVARFGRFPHRNEILGRTSTDEELSFLQEPGSSF